mgnify:CR=1 FL=1
MKNAIATDKLQNWINFDSVEELLQFLCEDMHLVGRMLKAHGVLTVDTLLVFRHMRYRGDTKRELIWIMIDDGLLLFEWERAWTFDAYHSFSQPSVLWIPDYEKDNSPLAEFCRFSISIAEKGRISKEYRKGNIKQEIGLHINEILFLRDDLGLYAIPFDEFPDEYFLDGISSYPMRALGFLFRESNDTGFLDLINCELFIQGPEWQYSRSFWFKKEPQLATGLYAYFILLAGDPKGWIDCDSDYDHECIFIKYHNGPVETIIFDLVNCAALVGGMPFEVWFTPQEDWKQAMKDWRLILQAESWEDLFVSLSYIDREDYYLDRHWKRFTHRYKTVDLSIVKQAVRYLYEWVEYIIDIYGGISTYSIF